MRILVIKALVVATVAIVALAIASARSQQQTRETFFGSPSQMPTTNTVKAASSVEAPTTRPCSFYLTENVAACDKLRYVSNQDPCRFEMRGLIEKADSEQPRKYAKKDSPYSKGVVNKEQDLRGPPQHWAFCFQPTTETKPVPSNASIEKSETFEFNGKSYHRLAFSDLSFSAVKAAFCAREAAANLAGAKPIGTTNPILLGFATDPVTFQIKDIKVFQRNIYGTIQPASVRPETVLKSLFTRKLVFKRKGVYSLVIQPRAVEKAFIYPMSVDICDKSYMRTNQEVPFDLKLSNFGIKDMVIAEVAYDGSGDISKLVLPSSDDAMKTVIANIISQKATIPKDVRGHISNNNYFYLDVGYSAIASATRQTPTAEELKKRYVIQEDPLEIGTVAYQRRPPPVDFASEPTYTLSMWIKVQAIAGGWRNILFFGSDDDWSRASPSTDQHKVDRTPGLWIWPNQARLHFVHRHGGRSEYAYNEHVDPAFSVPGLNKWFHYTAVIEPYRMRQYINGKLAMNPAIYDSPAEWNAVATKRLFLNLPNYVSRNGSVQVMRVYWENRALTEDEIRQLAAMQWSQAATGFQATPWECTSSIPTPTRRNAAGDIECMSSDARNCLWSANVSKCKESLTNIYTALNGKSLSCGEQHKAQWGGTGYESPTHWCSQARARLANYALPTSVRQLLAYVEGTTKASGIYDLGIDGQVFKVFVDYMPATGKAWLLVLNYLKNNDRRSNLMARKLKDGFPLYNKELGLGAYGDGDTMCWGHCTPDILGRLDFGAIRFFGRTSAHKRVMHFVSTDPAAVAYFKTGRGKMSAFTSGNWSKLADHTATIPSTAATGRWENRGDLALTDFPFFEPAKAHWGIGGGGTRYEVDDYCNTNPNPRGKCGNTQHLVYIS